MSQFDLNTAVGFAQVTTQNLSLLGGQLGSLLGLAPGQWDLVEGSYKANDPSNPGGKPVLFHIFKSNSQYQAALPSVTDKGGRRKVKYVFPYTDGQTTDDTGRKPSTFDLNIVLFGQNYKVGLTALLNELNKPFPGILKHPVRGDIQCVMEDYELVHSHEQRNAVALKLMMTEHNFNLGSFAQNFSDSSLKSALSSALSALNTVQNALDNIATDLLFPTALKNELKAMLANYQQQFGVTLQQINVAFNGGVSSDIPSLLPVNQGGNSSTTGVVLTKTFTTVASPSDPYSNLPLSNTQSPTVVTTAQATTAVNNLRDQVSAIIAVYDAEPTGQAPLAYYSDILNLKTSAIAMQGALEAAIQSSQAQIVNYVTPRLMSLREIAFANQLSLDAVIEIEILNEASLLSTNYVPAGTTVQVPTSG